MSRHPPLITKKEIIYRRSFIDDHNDRFDSIMRNPISYPPPPPPRRPEPERPMVVSHTYQSDFESEYQLSKINKKLDRIIDILRSNNISPPAKKSVEEQVNVDQGRQEQTRQYKDICERLEKLEHELTGKTLSVAPIQEQLKELTSKIHDLARVQEELAAQLTASNIAAEDIDELLKVINETRRDMEEKIGNIKQLSDGNYIHLEDKLDGYLRNQHGIQLQVDHLMHLLTHSSRPVSIVASRPTSAIGKDSISRSSSKSSNIKANLVHPTSRSPPPKTPSEVSYVSSTHPRSEKSASQKTPSTVISSNTVLSSKKSSVPPVVAPVTQKKNAGSSTYEILEKSKSIETMNAIYYAQKAASSIVSSSSGSFIAPLAIDERRNSQPATIFLTKKF